MSYGVWVADLNTPFPVVIMEHYYTHTASGRPAPRDWLFVSDDEEECREFHRWARVEFQCCKGKPDWDYWQYGGVDDRRNIVLFAGGG